MEMNEQANDQEKENDKILQEQKRDFDSNDIRINAVQPLFPKASQNLMSFHETIKFYKVIILEVILIILMEMGVCILICSVYNIPSKTKSFSIVFFFLIIFNVFIFFLKLIQIFQRIEQSLRNVYHYQMLLSLGNIFFMTGIMLYLEKVILIKDVFYYLLPHIFFAIMAIWAPANFYLFKNRISVANIPNLIQYIIIIHFFDSDSHFFKFVLFWIQLFLRLVLSLFLSIASFCYLYTIYFQRIDLRFDQKLFFASGTGVLFYVIWSGFLQYKFFEDIVYFIENGVFSVRMNTNLLDRRLFLTSVIYICFAGVTLLIILVGTYFLFRLRYDFTDYVTLATFTEKINLEIKKASDTYFVRNNDYQNLDEEAQKTENDENLCFLCFDDTNAIYLRPCGHSGICKECFLSYIQNKNECPMCKKQMTHAYIITYDKEKKAYFTKQKFIL